jgi:hypothetical protein
MTAGEDAGAAECDDGDQRPEGSGRPLAGRPGVRLRAVGMGPRPDQGEEHGRPRKLAASTRRGMVVSGLVPVQAARRSAAAREVRVGSVGRNGARSSSAAARRTSQSGARVVLRDLVGEGAEAELRDHDLALAVEHDVGGLKTVSGPERAAGWPSPSQAGQAFPAPGRPRPRRCQGPSRRRNREIRLPVVGAHGPTLDLMWIVC